MKELTRADLLIQAEAIAYKYQREGYSLTLRQLYYQLVARAIIPNSDKSYKRLGNTISSARLKGEFDMDLLIDRGRDAGASKHVICDLDVGEAEAKAAQYVVSIPNWAVEVDRWYGQTTHVSVWVEKDALHGVFEKPCEDLGVGLFACKGYPSHSAMWQWLQQLQEACEAAENGADWAISCVVILYFGDHDPDGWQIPRSANSALETFIEVYGVNVPEFVEFKRCALNMDQIEQYRPPPFPAKLSSSRYEGYVEEHGTTMAWELDALEPKVLDALIREEVLKHWDDAEREVWLKRQAQSRVELIEKMKQPDWNVEAFRRIGR